MTSDRPYLSCPAIKGHNGIAQYGHDHSVGQFVGRDNVIVLATPRAKPRSVKSSLAEEFDCEQTVAGDGKSGDSTIVDRHEQRWRIYTNWSKGTYSHSPRLIVMPCGNYR